MRRRLRRLEVSTFPFLAVLLCTMGSLILLLLVLDRRAKIVALHKANDATVQLTEAKKLRDQQAAQQLAEWEKRRDDLLGRLSAEQKVLRAELKQTQEHGALAESKIAVAQNRADKQGQLLRLAEERLADANHTLTARQLTANQSVKQSEEAQRELERQTAELVQLERALANLKSVRERQQNTYSVVPYLGRNGDNRQPLYFECRADSVVCHPDRVVLSGLQLSSAHLRAEVEKRLHDATSLSNQKGQDKPRLYVLLLVRPDGIDNYYKIQEALSSLKLDFGYELVERDWVFDFTAKDRIAEAPSLKASNQSIPPLQSQVPKGTALVAGTSDPAVGNLTGGSAKGSTSGPALGRPLAVMPQAGGGGASAWQPVLPATGPATRPGSYIGGPIGVPAPPTTASPPLAQPKASNKPADAKVAGPDTAGKVNDSGGNSALAPAASMPASPIPSIGRVLGNRDWVIYIECLGEGVVVKHGEQKFALQTLAAATKGEHPLVKTVREIIQRRQATVAPGEPPYRAMLRFKVHQDGFAAYYLAYPLLDALRLPMQRENVEKED